VTLTWKTLTLMPNDGRQWKRFTPLHTGFSLFDTMSLPLRSPLLVGQRASHASAVPSREHRHRDRRNSREEFKQRKPLLFAGVHLFGFV
jgi:hypothetical protein